MVLQQMFEEAEERIWMYRQNVSTITEWFTGPTGIDRQKWQEKEKRYSPTQGKRTEWVCLEQAE